MFATLRNEDVKITYGTDKIEGLFINVVYLKPEKTAESFMNSSRRTRGFGIEQIVKIAENHGFDISYEYEFVDREEEPFAGSGCGGGCEECVRRGV